MKRRQILKNKPVYLCLSILEIDKIVMYELWYDYMKQKFGKKSKIMLHKHKQIYCLPKNKRHFKGC